MKFSATAVALASVAFSATLAQGASISGCHFHGADYYCKDAEGNEGAVSPAPADKANAPTEYTGCHKHGSETFCLDAAGEEVQFVAEDHEHGEAAAVSPTSISSAAPVVTTSEAPAATTSNEAPAAPATTSTEAPVAPHSASATRPSITGCHFHGTAYHCKDVNGNEGIVSPAPTASQDAPASYTGCHNHGTDYFCAHDSEEVQFIVESDEEEGHNHGAATTSSVAPASSSATASTTRPSITGCHFHGTAYHCKDVNGNEGIVSPAPTASQDAPASYTGCHNHGADYFCAYNSKEVQFIVESTKATASASATGTTLAVASASKNSTGAATTGLEQTNDAVIGKRSAGTVLGLGFLALVLLL